VFYAMEQQMAPLATASSILATTDKPTAMTAPVT
jgi:hypothetical protein